MTDTKQLFTGGLIFAAVLVSGYAAASPENIRISVLFIAALTVTLASLFPRMSIYAWILGAIWVGPLWQDTISARFSVHSATAVLLGFLLLLRGFYQKNSLKFAWWEIAWPIFALASILTSLRDASQELMNPIFLVSSLLLPFTFYLFAREFFRTEETVRRLALVVVLLSIPMIFVGYYEYVTHEHIWYRGRAIVVNSAYGPYLSPGRYGLMQAIGFFMAMYLYWHYLRKRGRSLLGKSIWIVILLLLAYSTILCSERALILAFAAALIYILFQMRNWLVAIFLGVLLMLVTLQNVERLVSESFLEHKMTITDTSTKRRVAQMISGVKIVADKPVFGVGFHYFANPHRVDKYLSYYDGVSSRGRLIHNSPLYIAATGGLVSLAPYLIFQIGLLVLLLRISRRRRGDPMGYFALMVLSVYITQQLQNQTAVEFYSPILASMTFLLYGAVAGYDLTLRESAQVAANPEKAPDSCSLDSESCVPANEKAEA